ncbi:hypothetical protein QR680_007342 [Steinernema hermaphroditum]|uniref:Uncharacterized protein n=1 Tax=Steinernema hermaphroditum TaxID=289476 RepID=A0AA39ICW3_9BILA|nr:hypothetical protein QR680_007342 [Steinernema hermaphroditum]
MLLLTQGALMISTMFFVVSQCKVKKRPPAAVKGIAPSRSFPAPGASSTTPVGVAPRAAKSEAPVKTDKTQSSEVESKTKECKDNKEAPRKSERKILQKKDEKDGSKPLEGDVDPLAEKMQDTQHTVAASPHNVEDKTQHTVLTQSEATTTQDESMKMESMMKAAPTQYDTAS